jgi:hypothetical protein
MEGAYYSRGILAFFERETMVTAVLSLWKLIHFISSVFHIPGSPEKCMFLNHRAEGRKKGLEASAKPVCLCFPSRGKSLVSFS